MTDTEILGRLVEMARELLKEAVDQMQSVQRIIALLAQQRKRGFGTGYRPGYESDLRASLPKYEWLVASREAQYQAARIAAGVAPNFA